MRDFSLRTALSRGFLLLLLPLFLVEGPVVLAEEPDFETTTDAMRRETQWVVRRIENYHYSKKSLEELDFEEFLLDYISDLDYNRIYFLEEDIKAFRFRFGSNMRGWLNRGDLYPAFQIFKRYRERALNRIDWAFDRLNGEFDFSEEQTYVFDRSEEPWPASEAEADDLWERRLKYELINELLPKISEILDEEADKELPEDVSETVARTLDLTPFDILNRADFQEKIEEAKDDVRRRYERWRKNLLEIEPTYVQERYLTTLTNLYDPHSTYLSADSLEDFAMAMRNSFVGIGAILQDDDGYCTIRELLPGGPAEQSRLLDSGDVILGVAQGEGEMVDVVDMNLRKIVKLIKGKQGTEVRLQIRPGDAVDPSVRKVVSLIRDEIKLTANLASATVYEVPLETETVPVGVIDLPSFYGGNEDGISSTTEDVRELIAKLKDIGIEGLILDLRRNGGGLLSEAVSLTGLFIPEGPVVQVRDTLGRIDSRADTDPSVSWQGQLMVLVSRYSASASEIVAGALQNYGRALIVGDSSTHGKGTVQAILEPNNQSLFARMSNDKSGAAKITIQKFYLPNGDSTQRMGVVSDIVIPSINEYLPIGEADLDNALVWDTIEPLQFETREGYWSGYAPIDSLLIDTLKARSMARQDELPEFDYLKRNIEYYRKLREMEKVSLHMEKRKIQKDKEKAFREKMEDELIALAQDKFPHEEVLLDIRLEQEKLSKQIQEVAAGEDNPPLESDPDVGRDPESSLPENPDAADSDKEVAQADDDAGEANDEEAEEETPEFDIHLREGLRIMRDWIAWKDGRLTDLDPAALAAKADNSEPRDAEPARVDL